ncbi:MAG: MlaD family protein [Marinifilaceae bacterium]
MHLSREAKLGLTAVVAIIILIWGLNYLKARSLFAKDHTYYAYYDQIDGLKVSSSVMFRGYSVGQVRSIHFAGEYYNKVLVEFSVSKSIRIPSNSTAEISNLDLMGSKAIQILPGNSIHFALSGDTLTSCVQLSLMQQVNEQIAPIKIKVESLISSLDTLIGGLQGMLNGTDSTQQKGGLGSINRTLDNVEQITANLNLLVENEVQNINDILCNVNSVTSNLKSNNQHISNALENVSSITDSIEAANVGLMMSRINEVLMNVDSITSKIALGEGTVGKLIDQDEVYYNLVEVSSNLNKLMVDLQKNPKKYISFSVFSKTPREVELYNVVIRSSDAPLALDDLLYKKHPSLKMVYSGGKYLYIDGAYKKLTKAESELKQVKNTYPNAFIVKLPEVQK